MKDLMINKFKASLLMFMFFVSSLTAEVVLPEIFQDHMILQQGVSNKVWGTAEPGEEVTIRFSGKKYSTITEDSGEWKVELSSLEASSESREMMISGENSLVIKDILVGEVWLASGQSNMVSGIKQVPGLQRKIFVEERDNHRIRGYINGKWYLLSEQALHTSAVGFFFANRLEKALSVPVAYVVVAALGSKIEPFVPPEEAKAYSLGNKASGIFNKRIVPLAPYSFKGVIWYQGESNRGSENYFECLKALHEGWSRVFQMRSLPFYQVQIAPFNKALQKTSLISEGVWAAQYRAAKEISGMEIIPLHDTGISVKHIHPRSKQPVGERLAAMALKHQYGKNVVTRGPSMSAAFQKGGDVLVQFVKIDEGLTTKDGKSPSFFELSEDGITYLDAKAEIMGDKVKVFSPDQFVPKYVRMGWNDIAIPNLMDKNGWPVFAFPAQAVEVLDQD